DAMEFVVATNNYRASGGGNFPGMDGSNIVYETAETNQEIIKDWLIEQKTVDAAVTPIWSFVPIAGPGQVVFESSPEAKSLTGDGSRIRPVGDGPGGFALYGLTLRWAGTPPRARPSRARGRGEVTAPAPAPTA